MGWPFEGDWHGRKVKDLGEILSALCCALNERQELIGQTKTTFYIADGSQKSEPLPDDFGTLEPTARGLRIVGSASDLETNLSRLRSGVSSLIGAVAYKRFVDASDYGNLSVSTLLGKGNYGESWVTLKRAAQHSVWDQLREAFDELYVVYWRLLVSGTPYKTSRVGIDGAIEVAWDAARADTPERSPAIGDAQVGWHVGYYLPDWKAELYDKLEISLIDIAGVLLKGILRLTLHGSAAATQSVQIRHVETEWLFNVDPGDFYVPLEKDHGTDWPAVGGGTMLTLEVVSVVPEDVPRDPPTEGFGLTASYYASESRAYTDVSEELTDQAA